MDKATAHPVTPDLLALSDRFATLINRFIDAGLDSDTPKGGRLYRAYWSAWEAVRDFPARSLADVAAKAHDAKIIFEGGGAEDFVAMLLTDIDRLAAQ
jgi:hypothetical protein